jgi:hypothetical protein
VKAGRPLRRRTIRTLAPSEPDPSGEPRRYESAGGYVRLRWKVAPGEYVERYEREEDGSLLRTRATWRPGQPRAKPPARVDRERVRRLHEEGLRQVEIAKLLGCNTGTVSRALASIGVAARRPRDYVRLPNPVAVACMYVDQFMSLEEVARCTGSSVGAVKRVLTEQGITVRPPGRTARSRRRAYEMELREMRPLVVGRSGGRCEVAASPNCRGRGTLTHHRKLRSQGGGNELENLMDACVVCHGYVHRAVEESYERGWLVRSWDDPTRVALA